MSSRSVRILLSMILMTAFQAFTALAADKPAAVLHSSGTTTVNGSEAATTAALFDGDNIRTITGIVTISAPGSTVLVPPSSALVLNGNVLNLSSGIASISTTTGMTAQADAFTIAPATGGTAKFDVKRSGALLEIRATKGALTINSGTKTLAVAEGQTAALDASSGGSSAGLVSPSSSATKMLAGSASSIFSLDKTLADDPSNLNYCGQAICQHLKDISGFKACKCLK